MASFALLCYTMKASHKWRHSTGHLDENRQYVYVKTTKLKVQLGPDEQSSNTSAGEAESLRNVCFLGSVGHGKTSLNTSLIRSSGNGGDGGTEDDSIEHTRFEHGPTYNTQFTSANFDSEKYNSNVGTSDDQVSTSKSDTMVCNFIDTPGHVELLHEVTAALRLTDGAVVVVDPTLGIGIQTQKALTLAVGERVKPVLFINKMEKLLSASRSKDEIYKLLKKTVDDANNIIYRLSSGDEYMQNSLLSPVIGNIVFGSVLHGWAFTLQDLAQYFYKELELTLDELTKKLWGDNFYDGKTNMWSTSHSDNAERGFDKYILDPLLQIYDASPRLKKSEMNQLLEKLCITNFDHNLRIEGEDQIKDLMSNWLPVADTVFRLVVHHLPSPFVAQKYRAEALYDGSTFDEAFKAIENCDHRAPLMMYISKIIPAVEQGLFYAFGRVFSGKISTGQNVNIISSSHMPGSKEEIFECKIQNPNVIQGQNIKPSKEVSAGNICCILGGNKFLVKTATISTFKNSNALKNLQFNSPLVMRRSVEPKNPSELPKINEGLQWLCKTDPIVECRMEESGEQTISGTGQLHLDKSIKKLEEYAGIQLKKDKPVAAYRETVNCESKQACESSSPNRKSSMTMKAFPLPNKMVQDIENGSINSIGDLGSRNAQLSEKYKFDSIDAMNIWTFGPKSEHANILVDISKGVENITEIRDACINGFQWCTRQGVLCEEPMRGVGFNITDAKLSTSPNDRRLGQIIPLTRQLVYASFLTASPSLQEPIYLTEIICNNDVIDNLRQEIKKCRGTIVEEIDFPMEAIVVVKANIPVNDSLVFKYASFCKPKEEIVSQYIFNHWQDIPGNPTEPGPDNISYDIVQDIRYMKGLQEIIPSASSFLHLDPIH